MGQGLPMLVTQSHGISEGHPPMPTTTNTVRLHRVLRASPERVYPALLEPDAIAMWLPRDSPTSRPAPPACG